MVQYSVWPTCNNNCKFCLREYRAVWGKPQMINRIQNIRKNIKLIDWERDFEHGISLLGGELYFVEDIEIQNEFLLLIDDIIEYILKVSKNPLVRYSTVTNGIYNPNFLFKVLDKINDKVGIKYADINFSYDLKYRYSTEEHRELCLENINKVHARYDYRVGVQTIVTQYFIDAVLSGEFCIDKFENEIIPGNLLTLLYPHEINTGIKLPDFQFTRESFIEFLMFLKSNYPTHFDNFVSSTRNSSVFKYTGLKAIEKEHDFEKKPILSGGKEEITDCGHSILYRCYSNSDECMLCDMNEFMD